MFLLDPSEHEGLFTDCEQKRHLRGDGHRTSKRIMVTVCKRPQVGPVCSGSLKESRNEWSVRVQGGVPWTIGRGAFPSMDRSAMMNLAIRTCFAARSASGISRASTSSSPVPTSARSQSLLGLRMSVPVPPTEAELRTAWKHGPAAVGSKLRPRPRRHAHVVMRRLCVRPDSGANRRV